MAQNGGVSEPFRTGWLALSVLMTVSGVSSIVEGVLGWGGFLKVFIENYRVYVRTPIASAINFLLPTGWSVPFWLVDWGILTAGFFVAINVIWVHDFGHLPTQRGVNRLRSGRWLEALGYFAKYVVIFFFGPILLLILLAHPRPDVETPDGRRTKALKRAGLYYLYGILTLLVVMFLAWQVQKSTG